MKWTDTTAGFGDETTVISLENVTITANQKLAECELLRIFQDLDALSGSL